MCHGHLARARTAARTCPDGLNQDGHGSFAGQTRRGSGPMGLGGRMVGGTQHQHAERRSVGAAGTLRPAILPASLRTQSGDRDSGFGVRDSGRQNQSEIQGPKSEIASAAPASGVTNKSKVRGPKSEVANAIGTTEFGIRNPESRTPNPEFRIPPRPRTPSLPTTSNTTQSAVTPRFPR